VPKYLNSPETPIYTKSRTLYGLNLSKADLRKAGFAIVAASSGRGEPPARAPLGSRSVIVLGSEGQGVSPAIERAATAQVCIPGTGAVESLNVSVACGVLLAEAWRQRG